MVRLIGSSCLLITLLVLFSTSQYVAADDNEFIELIKERCGEASIPESNAVCDPEKGRIYVYDPEVKIFDDARRWCRQKFGAYRVADLISIENCEEWNRIPDVLQKFIPSQKESGSSNWIWTQIISTPRIKSSSSIPEIVMEHLNGDLNSNSNFDLRSCLQNIDTTEETKGNNVLVLLANELSVTPKLVHRTSDSKGHALCELRFPQGIIDPIPKPTEPLTTLPPITETIETETPPHHDERDSDDRRRRKVDTFFETLEDSLKQEDQPAQIVTEILLENLQNDSFVLTTSEHLDKTVGLAKELVKKIDDELSKETNKTAIISERITFTRDVCSILSTLMDGKNELCWNQTDVKNTIDHANEIIETTETIGFKLACELDQSTIIPVDAQAIQMEVFAFDNETGIDELSFPTKHLSGKDFAEIKFPTGVDFGAAASASPCGRPAGLGTIIKNISNYMDPVEDKMEIVSQLVSFSFGETVKNVNVQVSLAHSSLKRRGDVIQCVFWDPDNAIWNSSGCVYDEASSTRRKTVCHCSHLTNFAILMDMTGRQEDSQAKSILTLVCLTASVISLILTIFFLISLPPVKSTPITNKRVTITTNLCICLLVSNVILMFGVEHTENILWCRIISATLFYSLAATFTWMLLEGYLLYQMIVVVPLNFEFRSRWLYLIGYGLALIWLGITIAVLGTHALYDDTSYYCWISNPLYPSRIWFFAGPVALIIVSNMIIYGKSIQIALLSNLRKKNWAARGARPDQKSQDSHLVRRWLKGSCSLMILLGLTWTIGFLYFNEYSAWLSYVFIIVNGSQGVFIFIFEIVTNSKARPAIIRMVSGKFPSTQISSVSKTSSSNPLSTLSTRSSKLFNQQSLHGKDSSKGSSISPSAITERKKVTSDNEKPVIMELK